ncbi:MAG TPA: NDP-sugar synthase [Syntrophomonas sp.]|nr:NDP-sugar synthase [Syntrophomonas sp.]
MKAMIMAAGVGSRLMPMTADIPKPMIPVANRPLMENTLQLLSQHGIKEVIANLHYHGDMIRDYFHDGKAWGINLLYSPEEKLLGTAGGVKKCDWFLDETFLVISGDALTDIDLGRLLEEHQRCGALATIALKPVDEVEQFGVVVTDDVGRIVQFQEKPRSEEALSRTANTGIYIFEPEIFTMIPAGEFYDFGKQLFPWLVQSKAPFYGIPIGEYWCDVGDIKTYRQANADILCGRVKVPWVGQLRYDDRLNAVLMGEGASLGADVTIKGQVVIGAGCQIGAGTIIEDSVLWNDTVVGENAIIKESVVGSVCHIGKGVTLSPDSVVASGTYLPDK